MKETNSTEGIFNRREFLNLIRRGVLLSCCLPFSRYGKAETALLNKIFWVKDIPEQPFYQDNKKNCHAGVDCLLQIMGENGLKFYRSPQPSLLAGSLGLIAAEDVVLIKVNAQWKYRGCTNSDVVRGLIQKILDHPDGFTGEIIIFENGQGWGSLNCDTMGWWNVTYADDTVHANANDETHSFIHLRDIIFDDPRVSCFLLDPIKDVFIRSDDHMTDGYRTHGTVSYPCFTTPGGNRIELREGIWESGSYHQNLKLINIPVLKHHDTGGSEITAALKHVYGILTMSDGQSGSRHYSALGETCGTMMASVRTPVLNILDAIWVSHLSLKGWPSDTTTRVNQLLASQDPVALDYWAAKYTLFPVDNNMRHHPDFSGIQAWLQSATATINSNGGLRNDQQGIQVENVTPQESQMLTFGRSAVNAHKKDLIGSWNSNGICFRNTDTGLWKNVYYPSLLGAVGDMNGDDIDDLVGVWPGQNGVWIRFTDTGKWQMLSTTANGIAVGDMTGDGRLDFLGTWIGQGVFYRESISGTWVKMATPAEIITVGDLDGDGIDDLIGVWPEQGGVWVKYSSSGQWKNLASSADDITSGDMTGNGKADLLGTWSGQGVFYLDSNSGDWTKMAAPAAYIAAGDLDGDGIDDLIGVWPEQGGVWAKYSTTGHWEHLATSATWVAAGRMRSIGSSDESDDFFAQVSPLSNPPSLFNMDQLNRLGPGSSHFVFHSQENLMPPGRTDGKQSLPYGPGHPEFRCAVQSNLTPHPGLSRKTLLKR